MAELQDNVPQPGDAAAKLSGQDARQGQNVKGMIWVLIIGIALVVVAYAVMLALQTEPVTPGNRAVEGVEVAPSPGPAGPTPVTPSETAQSPG